MIPKKEVGRLTDGGVGHDDHHVCVSCQIVNKSCKVGVSYFHALETSLGPPVDVQNSYNSKDN